MKQRLDVALAARGLASSRSQAESFIRLGQVKVNGKIVTKNGTLVNETDEILSITGDQYVGRAALKLKSAAEAFKLDFAGKTVLDVGSSTGGFTQYALKYGAKKVIAVDVGTDQLHPSLRSDPRIELHEKTDIRDFRPPTNKTTVRSKNWSIDMVVADVSFISLREVLPAISRLVTPDSELVMMVKPQFESRTLNQVQGRLRSLKHKGVIKNDKMRRDILKDFEIWASRHFKIINKADSGIAGGKGNLERFYLLKKL